MTRSLRARLSLNGYRYFPYELTFASREIATVLNTRVSPVSGGFTVAASAVDPDKLRRLTYIDRALLPDGRTIRPDQALLEESASDPGKARRQSTRYSAHGIHEYRGKFNPQVVRAIGNMIGVQPGDAVLDPFCGSGTTILEAHHAGWSAFGVDLNPLGVLIANAKVAALRAPTAHLLASERALVKSLTAVTAGLDFTHAWSDHELNQVGGIGWKESLDDYTYLAAWFPLSALAQLVAILDAVQRLRPEIRLIFQVMVSDLVREVSLQDPNDLRIRRRKDAASNYPVIPLFLDGIARQLPRILKARQVVRPANTRQSAFVADSRESLLWLEKHNGNSPFDAVITSPPYATALPYIDTQRLSLTLLGLVKSQAIGTLERDVTGTREIRSSERRELEQLMTSNAPVEVAAQVPGEVLELCQKMTTSIDRNEDGFRRQNTPALVLKYFADMAKSFRAVHDVSKPGATYALVVGRNRSTLGGTEIVIETPELLAKTAALYGWTLRELVPMEAYSRFGMHQANSIRTEMLVLLERD